MHHRDKTVIRGEQRVGALDQRSGWRVCASSGLLCGVTRSPSFTCSFAPCPCSSCIGGRAGIGPLVETNVLWPLRPLARTSDSCHTLFPIPPLLSLLFLIPVTRILLLVSTLYRYCRIATMRPVRDIYTAPVFEQGLTHQQRNLQPTKPRTYHQHQHLHSSDMSTRASSTSPGTSRKVAKANATSSAPSSRPPVRSDPFYGHEETAVLCSKFVSL